MHLSLGVLARSGKADERRLAIHPEHFSRIDEELRPRIRLESGYGSHFGATDDVLAPFVGSIATREEIVAERASKRQSPEIGNAVTARCIEKGLSMNIANIPGLASVFRIAPPLTVSADEIDRGIEILDEAFTYACG